jgi:hypothetical protein
VSRPSSQVLLHTPQILAAAPAIRVGGSSGGDDDAADGAGELAAADSDAEAGGEPDKQLVDLVARCGSAVRKATGAER